MRTDYIVALLLALASVPSGNAMSAASDYFPWLHAHPGVNLVLSIAIAVLFLGAAIIVALRGERKAEKAGTAYPKLFWTVLITLVVATVGAIWWIWPLEKGLPGVQVTGFLRLYDTPEGRRRYIFQISNPEGGKAEFFLSASDIFTFSVTDIHGETYPLNVPYGTSGIPIDRYVFLYCDAGIDRKSTTIRLFIDGKQIQRRTFDLPIELGSNKWRVTIGADNNGQNKGPFKMAYFAVGHATETEVQINQEYELLVKAISALNEAIVP
jgi:hypothetical protein